MKRHNKIALVLPFLTIKKGCVKCHTTSGIAVAVFAHDPLAAVFATASSHFTPFHFGSAEKAEKDGKRLKRGD